MEYKIIKDKEYIRFYDGGIWYNFKIDDILLNLSVEQITNENIIKYYNKYYKY